MTTSLLPDEPSPQASDSPRSQCASRFQSLEIEETPIYLRTNMDLISDSESSSQSPRKRQRRSSANHTSPTPTPDKTLQIRPKPAHERPRRTSQPQLPSSPPLSPSPGSNGRRIKSPPPFDPALPSTPSRTPVTSPSKTAEAAVPRSVSPRSLDLADSISPPITTKRPPKRPSSPSLTSSSPAEQSFWQPKEITGHVIDTSTPDDDGLGINGIGFMPTAAMQEARRIRRKQQVSEWRAREAREDRRRRFEKRRGAGTGLDGRRAGAEALRDEGTRGVGAGGEGGDGREEMGLGQGLGIETGRRVVRFVDVGGK
ncbi:Endocytosis protein end4 [Elsinoe australis]|uniref:Endocytosis protein end4 n=1 Tax=Elsinoe australis TaxID=40998 RepID=A0A2P8A0D1_9PEZI|nr:Endocytosis protein end4 [Elsinoe australis]